MMINDNDGEYDDADDENDGGGINSGKSALFCFSRHCLSIHS